jgi:hypothetical protein
MQDIGWELVVVFGLSVLLFVLVRYQRYCCLSDQAEPKDSGKEKKHEY